MRKFLGINVIFIFFFSFLGTYLGLSCAYGEAVKGKRDISRKHKATGEYSAKIPHVQCSNDACCRLREGKELFDAGKYAESIGKLKTAYRELPAVGDYALFFMARAYSKIRAFDDSNGRINELLENYPATPLKKRARLLMIRNLMAKSDSSTEKEADYEVMKSLEQYIADYPEDAEIKMLFGQSLKKRGERERADRIFRQVYVTNTPYAESAYRELRPSDITAEDMLSKASNFIKDGEYRKAEALLRNAMPIAGDSLRDEVVKKIGVALFRQRRYKEAASEFARGGDTYNAARSLYRGGEIEAFQTAVSKLISMEDKRAASLLLALASKKRREGKTEEALRIYGNVKDSYPSLAEEALWGKAWTFYRSGDFEAALGALREINSAYQSQRYLYWKARCIDHLPEEGASEGGKTAGSFPPHALNRGRDFYSLLAGMREKNKEKNTSSIESANFNATEQAPCAQNVQGPSGDAPPVLHERREGAGYLSLPKNDLLSRSLERFGILMAIGMREDAVSELMKTSREISRPDVVLYLSYMLKESGAYRNAIALMSQVRQNQDSAEGLGMDADDILYPLAYWPVVEETARNHNLDPLVLLSVMREESRFDPEARSAAGALGLMQIMPQTAANLIGRTSTAGEICDVRTNITIGAYYLSFLIREFRSLPVAIAAYNAGEERVREWLRQGNYTSYDEFIEDIPFDETRNYVKKVLTTYSIYKERASRYPSFCGQQAS